MRIKLCTYVQQVPDHTRDKNKEKTRVVHDENTEQVIRAIIARDVHIIIDFQEHQIEFVSPRLYAVFRLLDFAADGPIYGSKVSVSRDEAMSRVKTSAARGELSLLNDILGTGAKSSQLEAVAQENGSLYTRARLIGGEEERAPGARVCRCV